MANADGFRGLAEEMASAYKERVQCISAIKQEVEGVKQETANMLGIFGNAHEEMAKTLTAELARFKSDLDAAEGERKNTDQAEIAERKDYIGDLRDKAQKLVDEFDKAHNEMAKTLTAELARFKSDLESGEADRKAAVEAEIAAVQAETRETAAAWSKLLTKMHSARGHGTITGPAKVKAAVATKPFRKPSGSPLGREKKRK